MLDICTFLGNTERDLTRNFLITNQVKSIDLYFMLIINFSFDMYLFFLLDFSSQLNRPHQLLNSYSG
jgi:hypothetical protein